MATQQPGNEQIHQRLDSSIVDLDDHRTDNLKRTHQLQVNKDNALERERVRLQKKYGADHPRVTKIINRLEYNRVAVPEIKQEIERSHITLPEFDARSWMVQGRVLNQDLTGIKGLTLALYDANGRVERRLGYACSDARGYYAIRYQTKEGEPPGLDEKNDYFLAVTDGKGKVCYKDDQPLHVVAGQADYRLIVLDEDKCAPPPGWTEDGDGDDNGDGSQTGEWTVTGTVRYDNKRAAAGLPVRLFSRQKEKDLSTAKTGRTGTFRFILNTEKFPQIFTGKSDLFLVVSDKAGNELYMTDKPLHPKIGETEELSIVLKG